MVQGRLEERTVAVMNILMIAMIVLNAFLVAMVLTFISRYINTEKERARMESRYDEKSEAWFKEVQRNIDLIRENERLKRKVKKLRSKK